MKKIRVLCIVLLLPFTLLTAYAVWDVGLIGIFAGQLASSGGLQVLVDLVIALVFFLCWMFPHARHTRRTPWPYLILTLAAGCFGPLLYFAFAKSDDPLWPVVDASNAPSKFEGA